MSGDDARTQLAEVEAAIDAHPGHAALHHHRGVLLAGLGRVDEARGAFLTALSIEPGHFGALNDLGTLLYRADFRTAARTAYAEAVRLHPDNPIGHINLANTLMAAGEVEGARAGFETALGLDPRHPDALQGLANLLQHQGEVEAAERLRQRSYAARTLVHTPYQGTGAPRRVLELVSAVGGNIPTRFALDPTLFDVHTLVVEAFDAAVLPAHDVVLNAIGDVDLAPDAPAAAARVLTLTAAPVINLPARVIQTDRAGVAHGLRGLPGVVAPRLERTPRTGLEAAAEAFGYPLLLRSPGYHTGQNFARVERPDDLAAAAAALPGEALLLIEPLDARDAKGAWRKYRVMLVGGRRFPLHLAVSEHWKVHYFTSAMAAHADHRAEEAAFLADMPKVLGPVATAALGHIQDTLGLDYAGVDFGLDAHGRLLLFEANAAMVVAPPGPESIWDYRRQATGRIISAVQALLLRPSHTA